jgi:DNA repair exonuclease SbcCD ATPase subunit
MILREVTVRNWRCIREWTMKAGGPGVYVIHGPNRTGKSSFFEAIRFALFDYDHNSGAQAVKEVIPRWDSGALPEVIVDFAVGAERFRLTKVFSKRKEGLSRLERWDHKGWVSEETDSKESDRRTRELLGFEKSDGGLNQLLWVPQGTVSLPDSGAQNPVLEKRLEEELGTLVTGSDLDFRNALLAACGRWFSEKTMKHKSGSSASPVSVWKGRMAAAEQEMKDLLRELEACEARVLQHDVLLEQVQVSQKTVDETEAELAVLDNQWKAFVERVQDHREASARLTQAKESLARRESRRDEWQKLQKQMNDSKAQLDDTTAELQTLEERLSEVTRDLDGCIQDEAGLRAQLTEHGAGLRLLEAREKQLANQAETAELEERSARVRLAAAEIGKLEQALSGPEAPSEEELGKLQQMQIGLRELQAQVRASALHMSLEAFLPLQLRVQRDDDTWEEVGLEKGAKAERMVRQGLVMELEGIGRLGLRRGQDDENIEDVAKRSEALEQRYEQLVRDWQEEASDEGALSRLSRRLAERTLWKQQLEQLRTETGRDAPDGEGALASELERLQQAQESLLTAYPELAAWSKAAQPLAELREAHDSEKRRLTGLLESAVSRKELVRTEHEKLSDESSRLALRQAGEDAAAQLLQGQFSVMGAEEEILVAIAESEKALAEAETSVAESALTTEEASVEERLKTTRGALEQRRKRLQEQAERLAALEGELRGAAGLHNRLTELEQRLKAAERHLDAEVVDSSAHHLLLTLFDKSRDDRVSKTLGPVADRVMAWTRELGLGGYRELSFAKGFIPDGLLEEASGINVSVDSESYGTREQLGLLVRLALGCALAVHEPHVAILDDPLAHSDQSKQHKMLTLLGRAVEGTPLDDGTTRSGQLQLFVLTCHPKRFDYLEGATQIPFAS